MPPDLLSLFSAQIKEWWPYVVEFFNRVWGFLVENIGWIETIFVFLSTALLFGVIVFTRKAKKEFEAYRGLTLRDVFGLGSKKSVEYFKKWELIKKKLDSRKEKRMAEAAIEARHLFDRLLHEFLYKGRTFRERLENFVDTVSFQRGDELLDAEEVARKLEGGEREKIGYDEALKIVEIYEEAMSKAFSYIGLKDKH